MQSYLATEDQLGAVGAETDIQLYGWVTTAHYYSLCVGVHRRIQIWTNVRQYELFVALLGTNSYLVYNCT